MTEKQKKLINLLKEMFQLDQSDLDFGIYRIMNQKADEINQFLQKDLIQTIKNAFNANENNQLEKELDALIKSIKDVGLNPEESPKVQELRKILNSADESKKNEDEIYSFLSNFFARYYKDGDFLSLRRYKKDTFAIPYEGEEVKLHWANSDQYYIKTSEYLRDYTFTLNSKKFHFKLVDADTETNNNKAQKDKERRFVIDKDNPLTEENGEVFIRFFYEQIGKVNQKNLNQEALEIIFSQDEKLIKELKTLSPTEKNKQRTICEKHLTDYTSRNSFDYFIHKDLRGFFERELDFYIKNEMLFIDDIIDITSSQMEHSLNKVRVFKKVALKIIDFLSQLEEFQKKLWLKKKFVIDTNYCITLDKIPSSFYKEIFTCKAQLDEWESLFGKEVAKKVRDLSMQMFGSEALASPDKPQNTDTLGGTKVPLPKEISSFFTSKEFDDIKYLPLDTKFFSKEFTDNLLEEFEDIDKECDGVLINSENFGALNLLQQRYKEQIKTVYIDPPYNTGNDGFLYNDNYQHSSWMSFMYDRILYAKNMLNKDGCLFSSINDNESSNLEIILKQMFLSNLYQTKISLKVRHEDRILRQDIPYQEVIEEVHFVGKENFKSGRIKNNKDKLKDYTYSIKIVDKPKKIIDIANYTVEIYDENAYEMKEVETSANNFKRYTIRGSLITQQGSASEYYELNLRSRKEQDGFGTLYKVINMGVKGDGLGYRYIQQPYANGGENGIYFQGVPTKTSEDKGKPYPNFYNFEKEFNVVGNEGGIKFPNGKKPIKLLKTLFKIANIKHNHTILDYFAGSGTTGHAVINLNREDGGKRKYILVEMGEYFESVLKPRILKVIYTDDWKDGKPQSSNGASHMIKYFKLESYEDTLNNLAFKKPNENLFTSGVKEDYMLNYMLDYETNDSLLHVDSFKNPYEYKLKIATSSVGETIDTHVDIVETFNYLLGLKVKTRRVSQGYLLIDGENLKNEKILIIWRNGQSNEELNKFFAKIDLNTKDKEFDTIYINGDNTLENLKTDEEHFKVKLIEEEFKNKMFGDKI